MHSQARVSLPITLQTLPPAILRGAGMLWPAGPREAGLGPASLPLPTSGCPSAVPLFIPGPPAAGGEEVNGRAQIWVKLVSRARSQRHLLGCTLPPTVSCKDASALSTKPTGLAGFREQNCNSSQPGCPILREREGCCLGDSASGSFERACVCPDASFRPQPGLQGKPLSLGILPILRVPKGCGPWQGDKRAIP